jgi:prefoldin beta subunit
MEKISKDIQEKIQQLQIFEQNLQNLLLQKQAFQFELSETENALDEIGKTKEDIYKLIGQVMLKASKAKIEKEMGQKKDILSLRMKAIEKQEGQLKEEIEKLRKDVMKKVK